MKVRAMEAILLLLLSVHLLKTAKSTNTSDVNAIHQLVKQNYNKNVRPGQNQSLPVIVYTTFELVSVLEFDEVKQELAVTGIFTFIWVDERIKWDPKLHEHIYHIMLPLNEVWTPPVSIVNPADAVHNMGQDWMKVRYLFNGTSFWSPGDVLRTVCTVNVTYFPFDTQICSIQLIPYGYLPGEVRFLSLEPKALKSFYTKNGEWEVVDSDLYTGDVPGVFSMLTVQLHMKRRSMFFLINVLLPVVFMGVLNILVFLLPAESGERVSFAVTVLLATAVFLTLVGDNMPKTSEPMSRLSYFLIIQLSLSLFICISTILNLRLYFKDEHTPVPKPLEFLTRSCVCIRRDKAYEKQKQAAEDTQRRVVRENGRAYPLDTEVSSHLDQTEETATWKDVSCMVDIVLGIVSLLWLLVAVIVYFALLTNKDI